MQAEFTQSNPGAEGCRESGESAPSDASQKKTKVRLLVISADRLPRGVIADLERSPLEITPTRTNLMGCTLRPSDVILLGDVLRLREVALALKRLRGTPPPIVILANPTEFRSGDPRYEGLQIIALPRHLSSDVVADSVLKSVVRHLKQSGEWDRSRRKASQMGFRTLTPVSSPQEDSSERLRPPPEPPGSSPRLPVVEPSPVLGVGRASKLGLPELPKGFPGSPLPAPAALPRFGTLPGTVVPTLEVAKAAIRQVGSAGEDEELTLRTDPAVSARLSASIMPESYSIHGSRFWVMDDDVARAHAVASCLSQLGALVEVTDLVLTKKRLDAVRAFDAVGVLVPEPRLGEMSEVLSGFAADWRLRWVRVIPVRWAEVYDERTSRVDEETLKLILLPHWQVEHDSVRDLLRMQPLSLEGTGPAKLIRAAGRLRKRVQLEIRSTTHSWRLEVGRENLYGVSLEDQAKNGQAARDALVQLLQVTEGTVQLSRTVSEETTGPLAPLSEALVFDGEASPVPITSSRSHTSVPVPSISPRIPMGLVKTQDTAGFRSWVERGRGATEALVRWGQRRVSWLRTELWDRRGEWTRRVLDHLPPVVRRNPRISATGVGLAAVAFCTALVVGLSSSTSPPEAKAEAPLHTAKPPSAPAALPEPVEQKPDPARRAHEVMNEPLVPGKRPGGCERWIGTEVGRRSPGQAKSAWRMARKSLMRGEMDTAQQRFCLSIQLDSQGPGTIGLIRYYFMLDDLMSAARWARWAVAERPDDPVAKQMLADALHQLGDESKARELLLDSMNVTASDFGVLRSVAMKYARNGYEALEAQDEPQADRLFRRATVLDAKNGLAAAGRGQMALKKNELDDALQWAESGVKLEPDNFQAQLVLGDVYNALRRDDDAKQAWLAAARLQPTSKEAKSRLGL